MALRSFSSILELRKHQSQTQIYTIFSDLLAYGLAPEVLAAPNPELKNKALLRLASHYFLEVAAPEVSLSAASFLGLLKQIASRVGEETNPEILADQTGLGVEKVRTCLEVLESTGLIYRLEGYPSDLNEASRGNFRLFFSDNGMWCSALAELKPASVALEPRRQWANFVLSERMKKRAAHHVQSHPYYWYTNQGHRLDYLEELGDEISGYNFGFEVEMLPSVQAFTRLYPGAFFMTVTIKNMWGFVT